ncbi:MAG: type III pantothenate kinase [Porphyromonas sp.]|nr:type III pantothenate kinase [Porphyromonas sp.]
MFQNVGGKAYKPGLDTVLKLLEKLGNPHQKLRTIHVAGTNGKGSTSSLLASVLHESGLKVGLFTSPHLVDFSERIRVDGKVIEEEFVVDFCNLVRPWCEELKLSPSFFELTTAMAFAYYLDKKVDIAVIEVGMGGRLDSTNVITPILSIITNVSLDHTAYLGGTLAEIASEKAGIIKPGVPVVLGNYEESDVLRAVEKKAKEEKAPLHLCRREVVLRSYEENADGSHGLESSLFGPLHLILRGRHQLENATTVLTALELLKTRLEGKRIEAEAVRRGFLNVENIGLAGRMQKLSDMPDLYIDTGHNVGAWNHLSPYLESVLDKGKELHIVIGMAEDKDVSAVFEMLPKRARYYITQSRGERACAAEKLSALAHSNGLNHIVVKPVWEALEQAYASAMRAQEKSVVLVCGSNFVVAEVLEKELSLLTSKWKAPNGTSLAGRFFVTVDSGNSALKATLFHGRVALWQQSFSSVDELLLPLQSVLEELAIPMDKVVGMVISTSVPCSELETKLNGIGLRTIRFDLDTLKLPFGIAYKSPQTLGQDRIAACVGASISAGKRDFLVVDCGTAITLDLVQDGAYRGGVIAPGLDMRLKALHDYTHRLPLVPKNLSTETLIGQNTEECVYHGTVSSARLEVAAWIEEISEKITPVLVYLTGGDRIYFETIAKNTIFADSCLVRTGLNEILITNV